MKKRRSPAAILSAALIAAFCSDWAAGADDRRADELFETAMSAYKLERYEDSATKFYDFMAAAPYDPRNDQAQYYTGRAFMHRRYLNKAVEEFTNLVEDFPDSQYTTLGMHNIAECYLEIRQPEKAVEYMEKVIARPVQIYHGTEDAMLKQLYENHRHDVFWLADRYLKDKQYDAAIAAYRKLPYEIEAFRCVVNVYYGLGQFDRIRDLIDTLQEKNRHEGFKFLIEFYARSKAFRQVKEIFSKLLQEKSPDHATDDLVWTTAWNFGHMGQEQWDWAMKQVSAHYPRMARRADYEMAVRHWQNLGYQEDLEMFVIKYRNGGDVDRVLRWKGITLEKANRAEEARKDYRRIGDPAQGHWYVAETFHGQYAAKKDVQAAVEEYARLRTAFYSMEWAAMAQWRIAELYRSTSQTDKAAEAFRHVEKRFGSVSIEGKALEDNLGRKSLQCGPEAQLALGDVRREAAQYDDAIMEYRVLVRKYRKTVQASVGAYHTALCYEGREDPETAVRVLKSVLIHYPQTAAAGDAHTRLETKYKVADTEVSDAVDFFEEREDKEKAKNYLEAPEKMLKEKK